MGTMTAIAKPSLSEAEIRAALKASGGSVTDAAAQLGIHRTWLHRLMKRMGIEVSRIVA